VILARHAVWWALFLLSGAILGAAGCRGEKPAAAPRAGGSPALIAKPGFEPPTDRLLTGRHLDLYVKVRRAAKDRSEADAARALGIDPDEFAWVRARIVEALVAEDEARVREAAAATYDRTIASLRKTLESVRDRETARTIQSQIAALERERGGMRSPDPLPSDIAANARLVGNRRAELEAVLE
jgi:hypothetical protein